MRKFLGAQYPLVNTPRGVLGPISGVDQIKADLLQLLQTNPGERCLTGDTLIPLANGEEYYIKDLINMDSFWVYSYDINRDMIVAGKAKAYLTIKDAELMEIELDNGEKVRCTPNHKWLLRDGTYRAAEELKVNDSLMPLYRNLNTSGYERIYQPYLKDYRETHLNFVLGSREVGVREVVHHVDLNKKNNEPDNLKWMTRKGHIELHKEISNAFRKKFNEDPEFQEEWRKKQKEGLIKYYENHDGSRKGVKLSDETKQKLSNNKNDFYKTSKGEEIKELLRQKAYEQFEKSGHPFKDKKHSEESKRKMKVKRPSMAGENNPSKRPEVIAKIKATWADKVAAKKNNHKVFSIKRLDYTEDCFDLHVEEYHNFALSVGVFVHNCMLPQYGVPLRRLHFEPNDPALEFEARKIIGDAIQQWEPRIEISNIYVSSKINERDLNINDTKEDLGAILNIKIEFYDPQEIDKVEDLELAVPIAGI